MSERKEPNSLAPAPAASKKAFNPYAKKMSPKPSACSAPAPSSAPAAASSSTSMPRNPYAKPTKIQGLQNQQRQEPQKQQKRSLPPPPARIEATTFSQAFGDVDPDADFGEEERAKQAAFDESAFASSTIGTNNNAEGDNGITARDHHTMLQPHMLHISTRQRGNPILAHIRNVPHGYSTMVPDYIFAPVRCGLFLSLRYHNLHPNYIHRRIAELKSDFEYRLLLCYVDLDDNTSPLLFLNDLCCQNNLSLILAWSEEEAARYLETVTAFDGKEKEATLIRGEKHFTDLQDQVHHALKAARNLQKKDAGHLMNQFGTFRNLTKASVEELSVCPGMGPKKVRRLYEAFHRPFSTEVARKRKKQKQEENNAKEAAAEKASSKTSNDVDIPESDEKMASC